MATMCTLGSRQAMYNSSAVSIGGNPQSLGEQERRQNPQFHTKTGAPRELERDSTAVTAVAVRCALLQNAGECQHTDAVDIIEYSSEQHL